MLQLPLPHRLMPYWYTLNYRATDRADVILNPMFFLWPQDSVCERLDTQFLVGEALLVAPVLVQGASDMLVYFPDEGGDPYYDFYTNEALFYKGWVEFQVNRDTLGLYWRAGYVVPMHMIDSTKNVMQNRESPFVLVVTLSRNKVSTGELYWDDGSSKNPTFTTLSFSAMDGFLDITRTQGGLPYALRLDNVIVLKDESFTVPKSVTVDSQNVEYHVTNNELRITNINKNMDVAQGMKIAWTYN